ncbi:hypothetical protein BC749_106306 [Flavobacterium araucananum]|nr:hypothetical protein BC749_106306 [Flavobacterium araucananum]
MTVMFESRKGNRDSRADFERELNILGENLRNGKMFFTEGTRKSTRDLTKVRYSPNKRVNLNTITEMVRTLAMSVNFDREKINPNIENE